MKAEAFSKLPIGTEVRLNKTCQVYGQLYPTMDHLAYVAAGSCGKLASEMVPFVRNQGSFRCVDLPPDTPLIDSLGNPVQYPNKHQNPYRVAARNLDIESTT